MSTNFESALQTKIQTKVYTTADGRVAIEQSKDSVVLLSPDEIQAVIKELHVCYDYCAVWKDTTPQ
jgi:hypothetical protein